MTDSNPIVDAIDLINKGELKEAESLLKEHVDTHPDSIEGWYNLGYVLSELDKDEDAVKAYDEALSIDNEIFEIWFNKANALYNLADYKAAKVCYERALDIDSEDAEAWNNLGNCLSRLTEGQKALEAYTRAVALDPTYAEAFYNKANCHFIEEDDEHAIAYAELAMHLKPQLSSRVSQWIDVARDRLESRKSEEAQRQKASKVAKVLEQDFSEERKGND